MAQGKKHFCFFLCLKRCAAVDVRREAERRRLPTKTIVQQREADIRSFPIFLCLIICLHSTLSETNFGMSVISFESLRYVRLATNVSAEKFSWRSDM